jgi:glycosyltransferase involved in cell wall biosynthesis
MSEQSLNPLLIFKDLIKSLRVLNEINPDILHCITIKPCLIGGVYSKLWKKKLVLSFVGLGRVFSSSAVFYKFIRGIVSITYKCISKKDDVFFIFEHENDREKIINLTGIVSDKTSVIDGAGINIEEYKLVPEPENETPVVLFASRLIWSKGLGDLIEVKKRLIKRGVFF